MAELMRGAVALPSIRVTDEPSLLRALEVYKLERLDLAEACLVAQAEATGVGAIASFDRSIDRDANIWRRELAGESDTALWHRALCLSVAHPDPSVASLREWADR